MLPKIDLPTYDLNLPSSGKEVTVRPFLVKEEKLLLIAVATDDVNEIIRTTKQVINNCIIRPEINIETLPFFDIDYLFIALRAKSIGEKITMNYICQYVDEDGTKCGGKFPVDIDISSVQIDKDESIKTEIKLNDNLIFNMKYPTYSVVKMLDSKDLSLENKIKLIIASTERIFANGQYYTNKDMSSDEMKEFIENLTQEQFDRLDEFVMNFPSFHIMSEGICTKCNKHHYVRFDDFINFFQ